MKLFTRFALLAAILALPLASAVATTFTVSIGSNFYAPAAITNAQVGDVIHFVWQSGFHPTQSDSPTPLWAVFTLGASNTTKDITLTTPGTFPYHCQAHASFNSGTNTYVGQVGTITVTGTATATLDARAAGVELTLYPNPSHGQITVKLEQKAGAEYKLRLSNIIGQEIRTVVLKPELTAAGLPLDVSDLRAGMYFYSLLVDGKVTSTKRLVLQN